MFFTLRLTINLFLTPYIVRYIHFLSLKFSFFSGFCRPRGVQTVFSQNGEFDQIHSVLPTTF